MVQMSLSFKTKAKSLISFPDLSSTVESVAEFKDLFTCQVHFLRIFAQVLQFQHFAENQAFQQRKSNQTLSDCSTINQALQNNHSISP
jgi:hypothetical protein